MPVAFTASSYKCNRLQAAFTLPMAVLEMSGRASATFTQCRRRHFVDATDRRRKSWPINIGIHAGRESISACSFGHPKGAHH